MSGLIMGKAYECLLPREQTSILVSMADHADHDGCGVFPSVALTAWKTGYSVRQVYRIVQALEDAGILVVVEQREGKATLYRIELSHVPKKPRHSGAAGRPKCANKTPDILDDSPNKTPDILDDSPNKTPDTMSQTPDTMSEVKIKPLTFQHKTPDISAPAYKERARVLNPNQKELIREERNTESPKKMGVVFSEDFVDIWKAYPQPGKLRSNKATCFAIWRKTDTDTRARILAATSVALGAAQFRDYTPGVERWLKGLWASYEEADSSLFMTATTSAPQKVGNDLKSQAEAMEIGIRRFMGETV